MGNSRRAILIATAMVSFSAAQSNAMDCTGSGLGEVCIDPLTGEIWSAADDYFRQSYGGGSAGGSRLSKYPNAAAGSPSGAPSGNSGETGVTTVLQPVTQSGNAEVMTPQGGSGGAVVLQNDDDSSAAAVCGSGTRC